MSRSKLAKILGVALAGVLAVGALTACGSSDSSENVTLKVGANLTPHAEILNHVKDQLAEEGVDLEVVEIEDSITPNEGVADGSLDANFFQHQPYLDSYNEEHEDANLVSVGTVHYEPFGIYSEKYTDLSDLPDGATIAVPNNVTNEARALLLLQDEGLITLSEDAGITATQNDIVSNPKNLKFTEIAPEQLVRSLPDVDIAVINGNYAIEGGLKISDALATESDQSVAAKTYANIIATREDNKDNEAIQKLIEVLQSEEVQQWIEEEYDGAVVPIVVE